MFKSLCKPYYGSSLHFEMTQYIVDNMIDEEILIEGSSYPKRKGVQRQNEKSRDKRGWLPIENLHETYTIKDSNL
jgi:hypothetical protein